MISSSSTGWSLFSFEGPKGRVLAARFRFLVCAFLARALVFPVAFFAVFFFAVFFFAFRPFTAPPFLVGSHHAVTNDDDDYFASARPFYRQDAFQAKATWPSRQSNLYNSFRCVQVVGTFCTTRLETGRRCPLTERVVQIASPSRRTRRVVQIALGHLYRSSAVYRLLCRVVQVGLGMAGSGAQFA